MHHGDSMEAGYTASRVRQLKYGSQCYLSPSGHIDAVKPGTKFVFPGQPNIHQMVKSSSSPSVYPTNYDRPHGVAAAESHYQKRLKPSVIYISPMAR